MIGLKEYFQYFSGYAKNFLGITNMISEKFTVCYFK